MGMLRIYFLFAAGLGIALGVPPALDFLSSIELLPDALQDDTPFDTFTRAGGMALSSAAGLMTWQAYRREGVKTPIPIVAAIGLFIGVTAALTMTGFGELESAGGLFEPVPA